MDKPESLIRFHELFMSLKGLDRQGWKKRGLKNVESVAAHSFSVAVLSMQLADQMKLDAEKCMRLALFHETAEIKIGDLIPSDPLYKDKKELEKKAISEIIHETGTDFFVNLVKEYDDALSKEAILVHDMDKIDMVLQALQYEKKFPEANLSEFFDYVEPRLKLTESKDIFEEIIRKRRSLRKI